MQAIRTVQRDRLQPVNGSLNPSVGSALETAARADPPLAMVEWRDAWFDLDQEGPQARRDDYLVRTVGFIVAEGPRFVSIAQEVLPDDEGFRAVTHIPLPIVERIVWLQASRHRV